QALGVDVGGRTPDDATAVLQARAETLLAGRLTIVSGDTVRHTTWRDVGLKLDSDALRDEALAVGRDGSPVRRLTEQLRTATGPYSLGVPTRTDDPALQTFLHALAASVDRSPRDARLLIQPDGQIQYTTSQTGRALDLSRAAAALADGAQRGVGEVALPVRD